MNIKYQILIYLEKIYQHKEKDSESQINNINITKNEKSKDKIMEQKDNQSDIYAKLKKLEVDLLGLFLKVKI